MNTFDTPQPIDVRIDIVGNARLVASDRVDTFVDIRPSNSAKSADVKIAEATRVELTDGKLEVIGPKGWKHHSPFGWSGSADVTIELPAGSTVNGYSAMGNFVSEGNLGDVHVKTAYGNITLDHTGSLDARSSYGDVRVADADGNAEISTSSGDLDVRNISGTANVKNSNGATKVGAVAGDLRVRSSNGDITIESADASIDAKTANGSIIAANVVRGSITLATANGDLEVGVREGTAAWLDVSSSYGDVRNSLASTDAPPATGETVEVRGRTSHGDVVIRRSAAKA